MITMTSTMAALALAGATMGGAETGLREADAPTVTIEVQIQRYTERPGGDLEPVRVVEGDADVKAQGAPDARVYIGDDPEFVFYGWVSPVASPRIATRSGERATIEIGEALSYAELTGAGDAMRLVREEGVVEGIRIEATPVSSGGGAVRFEELEVTLSEVVGRLDVTTRDGSRSEPIPGGRPIVREETFRLPVTLGADQQALVILEASSDERTSFFVRVGVSVDGAE
jgi:hypothetical protein